MCKFVYFCIVFNNESLVLYLFLIGYGNDSVFIYLRWIWNKEVVYILKDNLIGWFLSKMKVKIVFLGCYNFEDKGNDKNKYLDLFVLCVGILSG